MSSDESHRTCPYCGKKLDHPYWSHVQNNHPEEYQKRKTWKNLYADYISMGMSQDVSLQVIAELFNVEPKEVRFYLKKQNVL